MDTNINCKCCNYHKNFQHVLFENDSVVCVADDNNILIGACYIIPKAHKETPFDLSEREWIDTKKLIDITKTYLDTKYKPDGYNLGWNIGEVGGQFVYHSHLHVVPRYKDEPFAGKGIRHWLMQEENRRINNLKTPR
ncbi:HIT family protein [Gorillibacterium massiliense]|uniref:HIT family protein n=1 Tax=Gorillibacterium massiliense TaxID=1280390 RepID=UPI0005927E1B|nr:HIT family protein [Gorillibacterium massiliense]